MEFKEITSILLNKLNLNIKNNPSYKAVLSKFFELTNNKMYNYRIDVCKEIYKETKNLSKRIYKIDFDDMLINIEYEDINSSKIVEFSIMKENEEDYIVMLMEETGEKISNDTLAEVKFTPDQTIWKIGKSKTNGEGFYFDYKREIIKYDKNNKLINGSFDNELDEDFSKFFNVPIQDSRKYRLNYKQYVEYLNKCKKLGCMKALDKLYCSKEIIFGEVFEYNDLTNYFVDIEDELDDMEIDDETELEEEIEKRQAESIRRNELIKDNFKKSIGINGKFTMSKNLIINIETFIQSRDNTLFTKGFIIKKLDNKFKLYYVTITNEKITNINKEITLEEAQEMFYSHEFNKNIYGLTEFFEIKKGKSLKLD